MPSIAHRLSRRHCLKAVGVSLALPLLDAMASAQKPAAPQPRRAVFICTPLGLHTPFLNPKKAGQDFAITPYLEVLKDHRDDLSVLSGLSHPEINSGHDSIFSFLTSAPHPENRAGFRNTISIDQFAAEHIGDQTRVPALSLAGEGFGLSWTRTGALVPSDCWPASVFARLFLDGRPDEVQNQLRRVKDDQSILDAVGTQAKSMRSGLGSNDRDKIDEYFTGVRDLEKRLAKSEEWSKKPKPKVDVPPPKNNMNSADLIGRTRLLFDLAHLALQTDSTRLVAILLGGASQVPPIPGVSMDHHNLSHHGQDPDKLKQLGIVETETLKVYRDLLAKLKATKEGGGTLLDRTMVMLGSNLGSGNSHSCKNLPLLFAGGGFRHGQHLAFDPKSPPPLCNLYVSILQRLGIGVDKFGSSTGTLTGLDMVG